MTYEEWKQDYGLVYEPNYCLGTEADCRAAFIAGAASRDAEIAELVALLNCIQDNLNKGMSRSIQKLQARIIKQEITKARKP